ncbi:hypothetical protein EWW49_26020 [Pseudomonas syringae]|uniref:TULIP family P47-like protein n=1 Tax=Pseudomonas sp. MWU16-30316 TaxID=2878093 RepID=UPI001102AAB2|nr:TULIP family P47-like protein [Pseudomonas sp. MWU16-30316]TFZ34284.1 hypothetical protein EWW49_26020 [Pseudomonas syringae]
MADLSSTDIASTFGWDTVFGIHIREVNRAIIKAGSSPSAFKVDDVQDDVHVTGTFDPWQVTTGGDGDLIRLSIPISSMNLTVPMAAPYSGAATALVEVRLNFLPRQTIDTAVHELRVRTDAVSQQFPVVSVLSVSYSQAPPEFTGLAALSALLDTWLNANLGDFEHVFATVDLNRTADKKQFQWLQPTSVAYAYSDATTPGDGVLGVLCMTQGRSATGLIQQLSTQVIPANLTAAFLISKERLLSNLVLPTMPQVFGGSNLADFSLAADGESISTLSDAGIPFTVTTTKSDGSQDKTSSHLQSLTITVEATELQMSAVTKSDVSPGIEAYCQTQNFLGVKLVDRPDGEQTLTFFEARPSIQNKWNTTSEGITIAEEVLGVIALVAMVVLAVVSGGTAIAAAALVIGMVSGVAGGAMLITTAVLEMVKGGEAPAITDMVLDTTAPIVWADTADFKLSAARLNDSLQLVGDLKAGD